MDVRYLLILLLLVSCMPEGQVARSNLTEGTEGTTTGTTTGGTTTPVPTTVLSFNYLGTTSQGITVNASNLNTANIIGTMVQDYLSDSTNFNGQTYCLVSTFSLGGFSYQLRSRVIPVSYYDFTQKKTVKVYRVDFPDSANSLSNCAGTLFAPDIDGNYVAETSPAISYTPGSVCPTCTSTLTSTNVRIFKKETTLRQVPQGSLNLTTLTLRIDPNNSTSENNNSCTNTSCQARGFDCCLDNQCVNDGAEKSAGISQYPDLYETAKEEIIENPLAYLKYPQLYYICSSNTGTTTGSTTGGGYDEEFAKKKKDYACIQHLKSQTSVSPFQSEILTKTYTSAADCLTVEDNADTVPLLDEYYYYKNVVKRLYETCGCNKSTLELSVNDCAPFDYEAVGFDGTDPTEIRCTVQTSDSDTIPIQSRVSVSSRSAPHRLFESATGIEKTLSGTVTQEGPKFEYLDDANLVPSQSNFSMNALLGQMSVTLDKALPAKVVNIELDQVYLISTVSGTYTPCPECGKDSWLDAFSAHPFSTDGTGLQGLGFNTERDGFSTYNSGGNYEDTIFGRACWLPPTMLPFSHSAKSTTQAQRLNRLQTQAALYANGYQRDWYGFNKGALIGSFDGVSWFAVGRGRIVRSTTSKLFLAINAPFADLAIPSIHEVNIEAYNGITKAPSVDYDPAFHITDISNQNLGGTCQAHHMCNTDTDCVTRLGWEYMCADVKEIRTQWPQFDAAAGEKANTGNGSTTYDASGNPAVSTATTIDQILAKKGFPSTSSKRCVYRGAGAPCVVNPSSITDLNKKKTLTCAPNFFCANVSSGGLFNGKVARFGASLEEIPTSRNHLFGKDANVLGRPLSYVSSTDTTNLLPDVQATLRENIAQNHSLGLTQAGVCRPGKSLPESTNQVTQSNPFTQHQFADGSRRTDFINQIASCNSTLFTAYRQASCPVIGADGNYEMFATAAVPADLFQRARNQNVCGLQSLFDNTSLSSNADALVAFSPFRSVEAKTLPVQTVITKTLVRDACLRRPGQVCQTDLDCSPNKFHAEQTDVFSLSYFGNQAEKNYYSEYLVCGQTAPKPTYGDVTAYKAYDMSKNRCCREVGKDITTFTNYIPIAAAEGSYDSASIGLKMSLDSGAGITLPNDPKRYSRLATVEGLGTTKPLLTSYQNRNEGMNGLIENDVFGGNALTPNQWKTLTEANSETCCGGGWIRKFSDGTTDWTKTERVSLDVTNFRCLNSRSVMLTRPEEVSSQYGALPVDAQTLVDQDEGYYCKDGTNTTGACAMYSFSDSLTATDPVLDPFIPVSVSTRAPTYGSANLDHYFSPLSADTNSLTVINFGLTGGRRNISIKIPSYIPENAIAGLLATVAMDPDSGADVSCSGGVAAIASLDPLQDGAALGCGAGCCYTYDDTARILRVSASTALETGAFLNRTVGVNFSATAAGDGVGTIRRTRPGSNAYYLKRLGRLELTGIPQVPTQPLYCNDNANVLVPGIYDIIPGIFNRDEIETGLSGYSKSFRDSSNIFYMNHKTLQNEPVFSPNDFKCCTPLGKTADSSAKCCSNFGTAIPGTSNVTCALPAKTDLMVYFNRFVSNEGQGTDQPGGGLLEADFEATSGEPKLTAAVNLKITELGRAYCASGKVRQGGAFGRFEPEPQGPATNVSSRLYNIVDSTRDAGQNSSAGTTVTTGYTPFTQGFRWNHHLYCND